MEGKNHGLSEVFILSSHLSIDISEIVLFSQLHPLQFGFASDDYCSMPAAEQRTLGPRAILILCHKVPGKYWYQVSPEDGSLFNPLSKPWDAIRFINNGWLIAAQHESKDSTRENGKEKKIWCS